MATRICTQCGETIPDNCNYCTNCGAQAPSSIANPTPQPVVNPQSMGPKPTSYLALAILVTIFCCLPFGIVSIVKAAKVDSSWNAGRYIEAQENSRKARNWAIAAMLSDVIVAILYIVFYLFLGLTLINIK